MEEKSFNSTKQQLSIQYKEEINDQNETTTRTTTPEQRENNRVGMAFEKNTLSSSNEACVFI